MGVTQAVNRVLDKISEVIIKNVPELVLISGNVEKSIAAFTNRVPAIYVHPLTNKINTKSGGRLEGVLQIVIYLYHNIPAKSRDLNNISEKIIKAILCNSDFYASATDLQIVQIEGGFDIDCGAITQVTDPDLFTAGHYLSTNLIIQSITFNVTYYDNLI